MIHIRKASLEDLPLIHEMASVVFPHTYAKILSPEQLDYMMEWMYSIPNLQKQITEENHIIILPMRIISQSVMSQFSRKVKMCFIYKKYMSFPTSKENTMDKLFS